MKHLFTLLITLALTSCFAMTKPSYDLTVSYDPDAPPEWKLGWQHGCESGYSAYGNNYYKSMYKFKQDVNMVNNEYYFKAWNDGMNYCRAFINRRLAGDYLPYEPYPTLFNPKNLNVTGVGKRDDAPLVKSGLLSGKDDRGFFADMFDVKLIGYGTTQWGASVESCDWLNRCGDDIPKDAMGAFLGHE